MGQEKGVPQSACPSVLGQDPEPQTAPDVLVGILHGSHQCMNVGITVSCFGHKHLLNALNVNVKMCPKHKRANDSLHTKQVLSTSRVQGQMRQEHSISRCAKKDRTNDFKM